MFTARGTACLPPEGREVTSRREKVTEPKEKRRHLRGRTAFQANHFLPSVIPGLQPGDTHSIALQAKILLLLTCKKTNDNRR